MRRAHILSLLCCPPSAPVIFRRGWALEDSPACFRAHSWTRHFSHPDAELSLARRTSRCEVSEPQQKQFLESTNFLKCRGGAGTNQ